MCVGKTYSDVSTIVLKTQSYDIKNRRGAFQTSLTEKARTVHRDDSTTQTPKSDTFLPAVRQATANMFLNIKQMDTEDWEQKDPDVILPLY